MTMLDMDIYDLIKLRKSVRSYLPKDVEEDKLNRVLDAGRLAPSAGNRQEWRFIVVKEKEQRQKLAGATNHAFVAEAPVVLACCAENDGHTMPCGLPSFSIDAAIAIDHITLAAVAEGLGTCWIGGFDADKAKEVLGIPDGIAVVELLPIGYPADPSEQQKTRKSLDEIIRFETW
jgi:nitroreductase